VAVNNLNKVKIPGTGTTAARPSNPAVGDTYYNGTLGYQEIYTVNGWFALGAPASIPTSVVATNQGSGRAYNDGQASVAFNVGTEAGAAVNYTVTSSPGSYTATGTSSPILVTGLQSSTQYTYTIVGKNPYGTSNTSAASSAVTATTVPQAPTIGTATDTLAGGTVSLAYTANATGGLSNTYTATSSPGGITGTGSSPILISGLTNGTSYTFTITATNANGTSAASSASNNVTPSIDSFSVEYLLVAGGGGGASVSGGGAGEVSSSSLTLTPGVNHTVTVGAGGVINGGLGATGGSSQFSSVTATGGGAQINTWTGGTSGNGYAGGTGGNFNNPYIGGSGGGAAGAGVNGSVSGAGAAGVGTSAYSAIGVITSTGQLVSSTRYYGGGGGGGVEGSGTRALGGNGGGGNGCPIGSNGGSAGTANTGGGGGGGNGGNQSSGYSGGSGLVILKYPNSRTITVGAGLTSSTLTSGSFKYTTLTAGTGNVSW
jgi:hypothetical protein